MISQRRLAAVQALGQEAALAEVVPALLKRGVRPLLIKGRATARLLGVDPVERLSRDLDVLVADSALPAAAEVLTVLGFQDAFRGARSSEVAHSHAQMWKRDRPFPVVIDLHHSVHHVRSPDLLFAALSRDAHAITVGRATVEIPGDGACALIIALHAAQHGRRAVTPLEDLRLATVRVPEATWHRAASLATELGVVGSFAFGLGYVEGGATLAARLGVSGSGTVNDQLRAHDAPPGSGWFDLLRRASSISAAAAILRDALLPSPALVRACHPELGSSRLRLTAYYLLHWLRAPRVVERYAGVLVRVALARWRSPR